VDSPFVTWEGFVVDTDEQYRINAHGLLMESRRVDGAHWARRLDGERPWAQVPSDEPINLRILLRGDEMSAEHDGHDWVVTLHFDDVDVLAALTHIPSTGPTTARVTVSGGFVTDIILRLHRDADAHMWFWDHGAHVVVHHPVRPDSSGYRRSRHPAAIGAGDDDVGGHRPRSFRPAAETASSVAARCRRDSPPPPTSARSSPDAKSSIC
jgi:hypothetical protein